MTWQLGTVQWWIAGVRFTVGLDDLKDLFQPNDSLRFYMQLLVYYSWLKLNNIELQGAGGLLDAIALAYTSAVQSDTSTL